MLESKDVSRETSAKLHILRDMLIKWNGTLNLVSGTTIAAFDARHVNDSAQIIQYSKPAIRHWVDLGSGGGLPGLVVAALLGERAPHCRMTLVEADKRKCVFLREAARAMNITVDVIAERIEAVQPLDADVVSARALAPLKMLCFFAERHLRGDGVALFLKGANYREELRAAKDAGWRFDMSIHQSTTEPQSAVLELRNLTNAHS